MRRLVIHFHDEGVRHRIIGPGAWGDETALHPLCQPRCPIPEVSNR
jgi:hypothetical protein